MNADEKKLVIARLQTMPDNMRLCIGEFNGGREEMILEVENETKIGETILKAHMGYLRSFKDGIANAFDNEMPPYARDKIADFIKSKDHYDNCYYRKRLDARILEKTKARYETRLEDLAKFKAIIEKEIEEWKVEGNQITADPIYYYGATDSLKRLLEKLKEEKVLPP